MILTGSESLRQLDKFCCPGANNTGVQDYLILDNECVRSLLEECKRICLYDFAVPVDEITEMTKIIDPNKSILLEDFRVAVVYVVDNLSLLYRYIDGYTTETETMRYKYNASVIVDDINFGDTVPAILNFSLSANNTPIVITWDNIDNIIVDDIQYDTWKKAKNTWKNMSPERVTTTVILPNFDHSSEINLFLNQTTNKLSNVVEFDIGDDGIKFHIKLKIEFNISTLTPVFTIESVTLLGKFQDPAMIFIQNAITNLFVSPSLIINNTGDFVTLNAKNFMSLKSLLVLSSETIIKKLELFNNNNLTRKVKILLAK